MYNIDNTGSDFFVCENTTGCKINWGGYKIKQILYIHTHDTGRYIEPYGYQVSSPVLMRLAEEGALFRNAFSVAPTCSPSRTGLLTGRTAHAAGMLGLAHR